MKGKLHHHNDIVIPTIHDKKIQRTQLVVVEKSYGYQTWWILPHVPDDSLHSQVI